MPCPLRLVAATAALVALVACTDGVEPGAGATRPATPTPPRTVDAEPPETASPERPHPVSLPALFDIEPDGRAFRVRRELGRTDAYVRYFITYRSGDLTISGLMNVPLGEGPFPVIVLNHGYIDPEVYLTGRGFERTQEYLPRRGFAIVHIDYRNHAGSDDDPRNDVRLRLGYTEDAINAVDAIRRSRLPYLDRERIGMLGRSMGGGVTLNVAVVRPDLVDAMVVFSSVSSDTVDNFNRWIRRRRPIAREILERFDSPAEAPEFWRGVSPRTYFDRVEVPILMHHGTADSTTPFRWALETNRALRRQGADVTFYRYRGEEHAFSPAAFARAMDRTVTFFRHHLAAER